MGLAEIQTVMARLSIDRELRDRFFGDPTAVGSELGLGAQEALGLARTPKRQLEQFAESLRRKRRDQVRRIIPIAAGALGREFAVFFDRYIDEAPPRGSKAELEDAVDFVAALQRRSDELDPSWAADLARYELAWRQAARAGGVPIVRMFRFPVARLAAGLERKPVARRATVACWWRLTRTGKVRHIVMSVPGRGIRRG
jgi:hypothetical protein